MLGCSTTLVLNMPRFEVLAGLSWVVVQLYFSKCLILSFGSCLGFALAMAHYGIIVFCCHRISTENALKAKQGHAKTKHGGMGLLSNPNCQFDSFGSCLLARMYHRFVRLAVDFRKPQACLAGFWEALNSSFEWASGVVGSIFGRVSQDFTMPQAWLAWLFDAFFGIVRWHQAWCKRTCSN